MRVGYNYYDEEKAMFLSKEETRELEESGYLYNEEEDYIIFKNKKNGYYVIARTDDSIDTIKFNVEVGD